MALTLYNKKRDFKKTKEPSGKIARPSKKPIFVVQEHHASRLHYDFRLEGDGVLLSWAVPKGPSMNPAEKRLAVQVEDHPLSYASFRGEIPKGEYGAGHVEIWDSGTWDPPDTWQKDLKKGHLKFELHGRKLSGWWDLVRIQKSKDARQPNWLLMKKRGDEGRTKTTSKKKSPRKSSAGGTPPDFVPFQLAQLVDDPPKGPDWIHEIKFDGYRTLARVNLSPKSKTKTVQFLTRSGLDWTKKYGEDLNAAVAQLPVHTAIFDGEIVWLDSGGRSNFAGLQTALKNGDSKSLIYVIFDILFLNGQDLAGVPLKDRKEVLAKILSTPLSDRIRLSEFWRTPGRALFQKFCKQGLEGVISKDETQRASPGRSLDWQKTKCTHRQEFVIGGYTEGPHAAHPLAALLLGVYDANGIFQYVGRVGTGFTVQSARELLTEFKKRKSAQSPFSEKTGVPAAIYLKPELVAEVEFRSWEKDGFVRQGSFQALRFDKKAKTITRDESLHPPAKKSKLAPKKQKDETKTTDVKISHPDRVIFPKEKLTKAGLVTYAMQVSDLLLPYIEDRPLSLLRCPDTIGSCFFQKHIDRDLYDQVHVENVRAGERTEEIMTVHTVRGIAQLFQWGAVELHVWQMKKENIACPDQIIFDLDPDPGVPWKRVVAAAFSLRDLLKELKLQSYLKVTGGKGLHLQVPIAGKYPWEKVKEFSKSVVELLSERHPNEFITTMSKTKRKNKIFLDYLRNGWGSTAILPYSVRARDGASVALPIAWTDLSEKLDPAQFKIATLEKWLPVHRRQNPWKNYFQNPQLIQAFEKK